MGVDHGGLDIFMTKELLDGADVVTSFEQVGGETVPKSMWRNMFANSGSCCGAVNGFLHIGRTDMVAALPAACVAQGVRQGALLWLLLSRSTNQTGFFA